MSDTADDIDDLRLLLGDATTRVDKMCSRWNGELRAACRELYRLLDGGGSVSPNHFIYPFTIACRERSSKVVSFSEATVLPV